MTDSYVLGFLHSFSLNEWLLIDKGQMKSRAGDIQLKWSGIGGKRQLIDPPANDVNITFPRIEKPHAAMEREFLEETGWKVIAKRWHCFHIKTYKNCKIYCFVCACSPDELQKAVYAHKIEHEGQIAIAQYPDICFSPEEFTFDLRYIVPMIMLEYQKGMILQLDPEGVNSDFRRTME